MVCLEPVQLLPPAPWGSPTTPLLPRWHLETLSTVPLPAELLARPSYSASAVPGRVLGDLAGIWQLRSEPVGVGALRAVSRLVSRYPDPPWDHVVIPSGVHLARLLECPFRIRAMNCIRKAVKTGRLRSDRAVTVGQLLSLENLGRGTLLEVMCVAEAATDNGFLTATRSARTPDLSSSPLPDEPADCSNDGWGNAVPLLKRLLAVSIEFHGARTLSDALTSDLGELMTVLSMAASFDRVPLAKLAMGQTMTEEFFLALAEFWESLSPREQLIFEHRVVSKSRTLEDLGSKLDLTRERVRQIEKLIECKWRHPATAGSEARWWLHATAATIRRHVGPVVAFGVLQRRIASAFCDIEAGSGHIRITEVARQMLLRELAYVCSGGDCIDAEASAVVGELKKAARSVADDVGLVPEHELRGCVPEERWLEHWDVLLRRCGLHWVGDQLALRDTKKARVKAALLSIGRPATREEVGEVSGIEPAHVGSHLSVIPGVVRADKKRWGLADWVEDEYEGIPAEIIQRIDEDGGATRLERLIEELPRLFGVTESSVRSYVATPRFLLRDGYVSLADESTITLRPLHDAVHGHTPDGRPFWRFRVEARYFDGYSLLGLPPEVVKALGCKPDGRTWVSISSPAGCGPVSVGWPLASVAGTYVGYLSAPLRELGARPGDHALLAIDAGRSVSLHLDLPDGGDRRDKHAGHVASPDRGRDILQRMKHRQRGL